MLTTSHVDATHRTHNTLVESDRKRLSLLQYLGNPAPRQPYLLSYALQGDFRAVHPRPEIISELIVRKAWHVYWYYCSTYFCSDQRLLQILQIVD